MSREWIALEPLLILLSAERSSRLRQAPAEPLADHLRQKKQVLFSSEDRWSELESDQRLNNRHFLA